MGMRRIYRKIAKESGVTTTEVKRDMQAAITMAYTASQNGNVITKVYQNQIPKKGEIPTAEELICYVTRQKRLK